MQNSKILRSTVCKVIVLVMLVPTLLIFEGCTAEGSGEVILTTSPNGDTTTQVIGRIVLRSSPKLAFWMPPITGADLASIDPNQAIMNWGLNNAQIVSTSGSFTVTITDATSGVTLGQQTFQYVVSGTSLLVQDPAAFSAWLQQFASYPSVNATVEAATTMQTIATGTSTVTSNAVYQGVTYASGTARWARTRPCPTCQLQ